MSIPAGEGGDRGDKTTPAPSAKVGSSAQVKKVVVVTMFEEDDSVFAAMRAGARGYVLKSADADEVVKVVRAVAEGEAHFGPDVARRLMGFFSAPKPAAPLEVFPELTAREAEVLDLIGPRPQ
jgi:DNA-binding NarL/FixJ family response regulator